MTITLHRHHWDLIRPSDGMPLHEQVVWTFAPVAAGEEFRERTGILSRRHGSESVEVEVPVFSHVEDGKRLWVQWHKLGRDGHGAKEPDWLPAEMVWDLAVKGARGFGMAKKRVAGPTLFDISDQDEEIRKDGAYERETLRGLPLESQACFSASVSRIRAALREEAAAEKRENFTVEVIDSRRPCVDADAPTYMARGPALTALAAQPEGWVPAPVRWPEATLADVLQDVLSRLGQSSWGAIVAEVEAAARACPDVARVIGRRLAGDAEEITIV